MKLFLIPTKYDYHNQSEYVVMAETEESALALLQEYGKKQNWAQPFVPKHGITEVDGAVYNNDGCDC